MPGMAASIAFFMTVGKASPWIADGADHQWPVRRRPLADIGAEDGEIEGKMGEDMGDPARRPPVGGERRGVGRRHAVAPRRPVGRGNFGHAAEQALVLALAQQHRAIAAHGDEGSADALRPFELRQPVGKPFGIAETQRGAVAVERAQHAGRPARRADRRAEIHHRLREVARPRLRHQLLDDLVDRRLRLGQRRLDRLQPRDHPLDIAVDDRGRPAMGDRRDGGRRVAADAGQLEQAFDRVGEPPAMFAGDDVGAFLEVAGARIVAEAGPCLHDVVGFGAGERRDIRPARDEGAEIRLHRLDRRLLQHDFREPDAVGVRPRRRRRRHAPGQVAMVAVVPGEQPGGDCAAIFALAIAGLAAG